MTHTIWNKARNVIAIAALLVALAGLIVSGIFGKFLNRWPGGAPDFIWMYAAGRCWIQGANPYDAGQIRAAIESVQPYSNTGAFSYPPQSAAFFAPLAALSWPAARACWTVLQLIALAVIVAITTRMIWKRSRDSNLANFGAALVAAFALANPNSLYTVWAGQTSLIFLAAGIAAWLLAERQIYWAAGIALAIASMKPQQCAFIFLWFLLERHWKTLACACGTILAFCAYPAAKLGLAEIFIDWMRSIRTYSQFNDVAHTQNLQSLLVSAGIPSPDLSLVGVAAVIVLWAYRRRFMNEDALALLLGLQLLFLMAHIYDYVGIIPLLALLWIYAADRPKLWIPAAGLVIAFHIPLRLLMLLHSDVMFNWRVIVLAAMVAIVLWWSVAACRRLHEI
ncbi:MAG TPA: glycosyltransferase family 87 protein [Bryobacteraceae bacterium]|nr:glycosyltransferase family 87 protein [Bryobacteraceae bacterium]